ncbi:MAG: membrane protein insertase YidC [Elusimicrobiales bacterium]|nr:membrane protein insertase YidC [Elusimicrobiales bacterium]
MQKNLILAVVLSSLVYIGWYSYMEKKAPLQKPQTAAQQAQPQAGAPQAAAAPQAEAAALPENWQKSAVTIKAGKAEYLFHTESASLAGVVYQGPVAPVELIPDPARGFFHASFPGKFRLTSRTDRSVQFTAQQGQVRFTKKFTFDPDNGMNFLEISAVNTSGAAQTLAPWELRIGPGLSTVKSELKENPDLLKAEYTFMEEGRKHPTLKELKDEPAAHSWIWAGLNNRYFLTALTAGADLKDTRPLRRLEKVGEEEKTPVLVIPVPGAELKPGETRRWDSTFYLGPKDYLKLKQLGMGLDRSVDFGFFAPLAKLANSSVVYFRKVTGNYGVAIIILSVIIQIILTPLSFKSYKAMAVMKKIQPEMQSIQKRYKDDPKRMNQEVMDLYKRHGTNPLGGCLPMLLQIPVFFALFTALRNSWDLHGAPFFLWIKDLSAKDPFYVLPLIMGGIMFLQQHLSPQTSDPAQAAMMKWMPVIFTFMFLTFPSGLVLYWLINSTWGFAQSMYLQKKMG